MTHLRYTLSIICLCCAFIVSAQDLEIGDNYYFIATGGAPYEGDRNTKPLPSAPSTVVQIKANHRIEISYITEERVFFRYLNFSDETQQRLYNIAESSEPGPGITRIYHLPREEFLAITRPLYDLNRGFLFGPYTVPIRIRTNKSTSTDDDKFEFESNLLLGANVIYRQGLFRKREFPYIDFSLGIGLTKVNLNPENSILKDENGAFEEVEALSPSAFTYSLGALFHLGESVNAGIYFGKDRLSSADQETEWVYNQKTWFGIGINVALGNKSNINNSPNVENSGTASDSSR